MGRLRLRVQKNRSSAVHSPTSWLFLITTFGFALCWTLFSIFTVTALSCAQAIGITLWSGFGIAPIDLFWYGFLLLAALSFVNTVRFRPARQHYTHRFFELLLIGFGLVTVSEWESLVHPGLGDRPVMEFIHDRIILPSPFFSIDYFVLEEARADYPKPPSGVEPGSFPEIGPPAPYVDETDFPLGILDRPASECACWNSYGEAARYEHHAIKAEVYYGYTSLDHAYEQMDQMGPPPHEADWCPAIRDLARLPR